MTLLKKINLFEIYFFPLLSKKNRKESWVHNHKIKIIKIIDSLVKIFDICSFFFGFFLLFLLLLLLWHTDILLISRDCSFPLSFGSAIINSNNSRGKKGILLQAFWMRGNNARGHNYDWDLLSFLFFIWLEAEVKWAESLKI